MNVPNLNFPNSKWQQLDTRQRDSTPAPQLGERGYLEGGSGAVGQLRLVPIRYHSPRVVSFLRQWLSHSSVVFSSDSLLPFFRTMKSRGEAANVCTRPGAPCEHRSASALSAQVEARPPLAAALAPRLRVQGCRNQSSRQDLLVPRMTRQASQKWRRRTTKSCSYATCASLRRRAL